MISKTKSGIKPKIIYKYKIKEFLDQLPNAEYVQAKNTLPDFLNVNKRTFEKYLYTYLTDPYEMPVKQFSLLAFYFHCKMEDLLNYSPEQFIRRKMNAQEELAARLGLTK